MNYYNFQINIVPISSKHIVMELLSVVYKKLKNSKTKLLNRILILVSQIFQKKISTEYRTKGVFSIIEKQKFELPQDTRFNKKSQQLWHLYI